MIPNPKKNITVDFTLAEAKSAVKKIPFYFHQKYTLEKQNDILNQTTFGALEFLSLGVYVDINLNPISATRTDIIVEIRRKLGAFDQWVEVSKANRHIEDIFNGISVLLQHERDLSKSVETPNPVTVIKYKQSWNELRAFLTAFPTTYSNAYKLINSDEDKVSLRRLPQLKDDVVLDKDAILNINKVAESEGETVIKFEITNDENKIATAGELSRNNLILKVTMNLLMSSINKSLGIVQAPVKKTTKKDPTLTIIIAIVIVVLVVVWILNLIH